MARTAAFLLLGCIGLTAVAQRSAEAQGGGLVVAAAGGLAAQSPAPAVDERWFGRLAAGATTQDPYAYSTRGLMYGGAAGFFFRERTAIRVDVWYAKFERRIDNLSCSGIGLGGSCTGDPRAPDSQREWAGSAVLEWRLMERGLYATGGVAALYRRGAGLDSPGLSAGPTVGIGLRFGSVIAVEARLVRLVVSPARESWSVPVALTFGP